MDINIDISGEYLSELLKAYRKKHGFSQQKISDLVGIKRTTYAKYELGRKPEIDIILKLCNVYGVSIEEMFSAYDGNIISAQTEGLSAPDSNSNNLQIRFVDKQEQKLLELFRSTSDKAAIIDFANSLFTREQLDDIDE
jgi:transcriptional regulator with XRE-family HTH domain